MSLIKCLKFIKIKVIIKKTKMFVQRQGRQYYSTAHIKAAEERLTEFNKERWLGHA